MKLIPVVAASIARTACPDCRQAVSVGVRGDNGQRVMFSGDPMGFRLTKNALGELVDHFSEADLHGCLK